MSSYDRARVLDDFAVLFFFLEQVTLRQLIVLKGSDILLSMGLHLNLVPTSPRHV